MIFESEVLPPSVHTDAERLRVIVREFNIAPESVALAAELLFKNRLGTAEIGRQEAEALFRTRGHQLADRLLREAGMLLSSEEMAEKLSISRQAVHERKGRRTLWAVAVPGRRGYLFPLWQLEGKLVRPWVPKLLIHFATGLDALAYILAPRVSQGGKRYLDLALTGDERTIAKMLALASRSGESA